jgi:hypothetical protein
MDTKKSKNTKRKNTDEITKILGRINDLLYNKMKEDRRPQTIIIREALTQYYFKNERKIDVNSPLLAVNNKKIEDRYQIDCERS